MLSLFLYYHCPGNGRTYKNYQPAAVQQGQPTFRVRKTENNITGKVFVALSYLHYIGLAKLAPQMWAGTLDHERHRSGKELAPSTLLAWAQRRSVLSSGRSSPLHRHHWVSIVPSSKALMAFMVSPYHHTTKMQLFLRETRPEWCLGSPKEKQREDCFF